MNTTKTNIPNLTFERIYIEYPEYYGQEMINRHIDRYKWASTYLKETNIIIDVGCGSGYGSNMLAEKCKSVIGIDIDTLTIRYAQEKYIKDNLFFMPMDIAKVVQWEKKFDVIVCIEMIEHFDESDTDRILAVFYNWLNAGGKLILTTPNKTKSNGNNTYHKKEYTEENIKETIGKYFGTVGTHIKDNFIYVIAKKNGHN